MEHFIGRELAGDRSQILADESGDHAEIGIHGTLFEALRKLHDVGRGLNRGGVEAAHIFIARLFGHGLAAQFADGGDQRITVEFVIALESDGNAKRSLVEEAAFGTNLIGVDGFMLEAERDVQDADVGRGIARHALSGLRQRTVASKQRHGACGERCGGSQKAAA